MNCVAILWFTANIWISDPLSNDTTIVYILHIIIVCMNLFMFGLMAWYGLQFKEFSLRFVYPFIVIIVWFIGPAIFSVFHWGGLKVFLHFLVKKRSVGFWIYLLVCAIIYSSFSILAKKRGPVERSGSNLDL
jgi:hypothetical protein